MYRPAIRGLKPPPMSKPSVPDDRPLVLLFMTQPLKPAPIFNPLVPDVDLATVYTGGLKPPPISKPSVPDDRPLFLLFMTQPLKPAPIFNPLVPDERPSSLRCITQLLAPMAIKWHRFAVHFRLCRYSFNEMSGLAARVLSPKNPRRSLPCCVLA